VGLVLGQSAWQSTAAQLVVAPNLDIAALAAAKEWVLPPLTLVLDADQTGASQYDWRAIEPLSPEKRWGYAAQWFALAVALCTIYIGVNLHRKETHAD